MRAAGDAIVTTSRVRGRSPSTVEALLVAALAVALAVASSTGPQAGRPGAPISSVAATTEVVAIRAKANNQYVSADNAGASSLIANRTAIGAWETFDLIRVSSTDVYLRAHANGKYVCAEGAGGQALISNRDAGGPWETFQLINNSDGTKSLRARANNKLVTAESAGGAPLIANRTTVGPWEKFDVVTVDSAPTTPSNPTPTSWPGSNNTGVLAGTRLSKYGGPCTVSSPVTISNVDATACPAIVIRGAKGVRLTNSFLPRVEATDGVGSVTIVDSTIRAGNWVGGAVWGSNITASRLNISGGQHSFHCGDHCTVTDSWLHDQHNPDGGAFHNNAFISNGGQHMVVRHNTLHCTAILNATDGGCTADISLFGDFEPINDVLVENNLLRANNSSISYCAYGGHQPAKRYPVATNVRYINNVFERGPNGKCGVYGPVTSFQGTAAGNVWSGNRFDDGQNINP